jgi:hypothetical protein
VKNIRKQTLVVRISLLLCIASLLVALSLTGLYIYNNSQVENTARSIAKERALDSATTIEETLSKLPDIAQSIADDITSGKLTDEQVEDRLVSELEMCPRINAITAAYVPEFVPDFAPQADRNLYSPWSYRQPDGEIVILRIEDKYDYTKPDGSENPKDPDGEPLKTDWYHRPIDMGPSWGEPYFGTYLQDYWAGYGTPFYRADPNTGQQVIAGIIDVSLTLDGFQELIGTIDLERPGSGYGFILSKKGTFIAHPIREFVTSKKNISDISDSLNEESLGQSSEQTMVVNHVDKGSGQSSWIFLNCIPSTDWWVGIVLDKGLIIRSNLLDRQAQLLQVGIAMATLAFLFFLLILLFRAHKGTNMRLWAVAASFSVLCIIGTGYIWFLNISKPSGEDVRDIMLADRAISEKVVADWGRDLIDPVYVPTGVLIQSMDFTTAHDILITGYIWQKYSDNMPDWAKPDSGEVGFILPQEIGWKMTSEAYRQTYRKKKGNQEVIEEVIGWNVRATIRQEIDYTQYPFHREDVEIPIWHKNFDRNVILTPDLVSYATTAPESLSYVGQDFFLEGWNADRTFFSYRERSYNTDFGLNSYLRQQKIPELYLHLSLTRQFIDAFISHIIPIAVVICLLFAVLVVVTRREEKIKIIGVTASTVLAYCAALFFTVVLLHINLRTGLEAPARIVYLEYLYFMVYASILGVSVNAILFSSQVKIWLVQYRENLLIELLYWPVLTGLLLAISLLVFL